jgi:hypothetical protein
MKNTFKIKNEMDFREIPVMSENCYLEMAMDESDSV